MVENESTESPSKRYKTHSLPSSATRINRSINMVFRPLAASAGALPLCSLGDELRDEETERRAAVGLRGDQDPALSKRRHLLEGVRLRACLAGDERQLEAHGSLAARRVQIGVHGVAPGLGRRFE